MPTTALCACGCGQTLVVATRSRRFLPRHAFSWNHPDPEVLRTRFRAKTSPQPDGCWLWTGTIGSRGYGQLYFRGKVDKAHRVAFRLFKGPVPAGRQVCHSCDTPACVNPDHLWLGTAASNMLDCVNKRRSHPHALDGIARKKARALIEAGVSKPKVARRLGVTKRSLYNLERRGTL